MNNEIDNLRLGTAAYYPISFCAHPLQCLEYLATKCQVTKEKSKAIRSSRTNNFCFEVEAGGICGVGCELIGNSSDVSVISAAHQRLRRGLQKSLHPLNLPPIRY